MYYYYRLRGFSIICMKSSSYLHLAVILIATTLRLLPTQYSTNWVMQCDTLHNIALSCIEINIHVGFNMLKGRCSNYFQQRCL